jgi:hypothetical protein
MNFKNIFIFTIKMGEKKNLQEDVRIVKVLLPYWGRKTKEQ